MIDVFFYYTGLILHLLLQKRRSGAVLLSQTLFLPYQLHIISLQKEDRKLSEEAGIVLLRPPPSGELEGAYDSQLRIIQHNLFLSV